MTVNAESVASRVLALFNSAQDPVDLQKAIRDDPNFGCPLRQGISPGQSPLSF